MIGQLTAVTGYNHARAAIAPRPGGAAAQISPTTSAAGSAADRFTKVLEQVDANAAGAMSGTVETQRLVQTIAEAELALETAVAIRDKVVEAYQEILRMPV